MARMLIYDLRRVLNTSTFSKIKPPSLLSFACWTADSLDFLEERFLTIAFDGNTQ